MCCSTEASRHAARAARIVVCSTSAQICAVPAVEEGFDLGVGREPVRVLAVLEENCDGLVRIELPLPIVSALDHHQPGDRRASGARGRRNEAVDVYFGGGTIA